MDKEDARMLPYINQILKNHNMSTFDDLQKKLNDALSGTQKEMYDDVSSAPPSYLNSSLKLEATAREQCPETICWR